MKLHRYTNVEDFGRETLDTLMENEVLNNLPISFINSGPERDTSDWLMYSVKDNTGAVKLVAACTPPFNIVLYEAGCIQNDDAVSALVRGLKVEGVTLPGVLAECSLARRFAEEFAGEGNFSTKISLISMRLDSPPAAPDIPGALREVNERDMFFLPYWVREFGRDCNLEYSEVAVHYDKLSERLGTQSFYLWDEGTPRALTAFGRKLVNGVVINHVYSPPFWRGKGYGRAVVSAVCRLAFERGNDFVALFADTANPVSCGLYHSLGFKDVCRFDELRFSGKCE